MHPRVRYECRSTPMPCERAPLLAPVAW
jgi:hypothetical protein